MFLITLGTSHLGVGQNIFMQVPMRNFVSNGKSAKGRICMCLIHISHTYGFKMDDHVINNGHFSF